MILLLKFISAVASFSIGFGGSEHQMIPDDKKTNTRIIGNRRHLHW